MPTAVSLPAQTPEKAVPVRAPHHFAFVDALRGYAIVAVIMHHSAQMVIIHHPAEIAPLGTNVQDFLLAGRYGVQLFFAISAFTLFWSLRTRTSVDRSPHKAFFTRRFFRIAPLFWIAAAFYLWQPVEIRSYFAPNGIGWEQIASTLLFVHGWYPTTINSIVPGGWSIGAEVMFYLCIPWLFKRITSLEGALWITLIVTIIVRLGEQIAITLIGRHFPPSWNELIVQFVYWTFPSQAPVFCLGFVLYFILMQQMMSRGHLAGSVQEAAAGAGHGGKRKFAILLILIGMLNILGLPEQVIYGGAFVLFAWALAIHPMKILVNPVIRFIGVISYSIYIWHFWIFNQLSPIVTAHFHPMHSEKMDALCQFAAIFLITAVLSILVATVSYYAIELPSQRLGKRMIDRMGWGPVRTNRVPVAA